MLGANSKSGTEALHLLPRGDPEFGGLLENYYVLPWNSFAAISSPNESRRFAEFGIMTTFLLRKPKLYRHIKRTDQHQENSCNLQLLNPTSVGCTRASEQINGKDVNQYALLIASIIIRNVHSYLIAAHKGRKRCGIHCFG